MGKKKQAAGEADEPEEAMREAARPVEKMMNKRMKPPIVPVESHPNGGLVEKKSKLPNERNMGNPTASQPIATTGAATISSRKTNTDVMNKPDPLIMDAPVKEAKAVPLALDA